MDRSDSITNLMVALGAAQAEMELLERDQENPFFHATYSSLGASIKGSRVQLHNNNLTITQPCEYLTESRMVKVITLMMHESGEWMKSELVLPVLHTEGKAPNFLQCIGISMSYGRRYSYVAMITQASEDTDAEGLGGQAPGNGEQSPKTGKGKGRGKGKTQPPPGGKTEEPPPPPPNPQEARSKVRKEIIDKITMSVKGVDDKLWPDGYLEDVKARMKATKDLEVPKVEYAALRVILNEVAAKGVEINKVAAPQTVTFADAEKLIKGAGLGAQETSFYLDSLEGVKDDPAALAAAYAEIKGMLDKARDLPLDEK
jgi:hypothetical protein